MKKKISNIISLYKHYKHSHVPPYGIFARIQERLTLEKPRTLEH